MGDLNRFVLGQVAFGYGWSTLQAPTRYYRYNVLEGVVQYTDENIQKVKKVNWKKSSFSLLELMHTMVEEMQSWKPIELN